MTGDIEEAVLDPVPDGPAAVVRLAAAIAVQDAAAHMRHTQSIADAAFGAAQQMLLGGGNATAAQEMLTIAQNAVAAATANFVSLSNAAMEILRGATVGAGQPQPKRALET